MMPQGEKKIPFLTSCHIQNGDTLKILQNNSSICYMSKVYKKQMNFSFLDLSPMFLIMQMPPALKKEMEILDIFDSVHCR